MTYQIRIEGLVVDGHPHQLLYSNLETAARAFDHLTRKTEYQYYNIVFNELKTAELSVRKAKEKPLPPCPRGHRGLIDGKPIVVRGSREGTFECKVCGLF